MKSPSRASVRWGTLFLATGAICFFMFSSGSVSRSAAPPARSTGVVFTDTNETQNEVYAYIRLGNGSLKMQGIYSTQGQGRNGMFNNQGALALTTDHKFLYVTNFGSNDITAFSVAPSGLTFIGRYPSGGTVPDSVTIYKNLLYVLNHGNPPNITGFLRNADGSLTALGSTQALSGSNVGGVQVGFNNAGDVLVVSENASNNLDTFTVNADGTANPLQIFASAGPGPFGFVFDRRGHLLMSESKMSSMSSYALSDTGQLTVISGDVPDLGKAACWAVVTASKKYPQQYTYTTNTDSDTVSGYAVGTDGTLTLLNPSNGIAFSFPAGSHPLDELLDSSSSFLFVLNEFTGSIAVLRIHTNGSLSQSSNTVGIPTTAYGLAGY